MEIEVLGIRHHGVGSAKNLLARLKEINPDHIIIEGPEELMNCFNIDIDTIKPPVSILLYNPNELSNSSFYPFAEYSPEWQAIKFAQKNNISFTTADLPKKISFGIAKKRKDELKEKLLAENDSEEEGLENKSILEEKEKKLIAPEGYEFHNHPIEVIAKIEGYENTELWWEHNFEQKFVVEPKEHFQAVLTLMTALRDTYVNHDFEENELREAFMRNAVRKAIKEGKEKIVFVCGAWHSPAILEYNSKEKKKSDREIIKRLPREKVEATWIPWLNSRLAWKSGYGAGINSPGWYEYLWKHQKDTGERWLIYVAKVFREKVIDVSTAHVIETLRLAKTLASLRGLSRPGLAEMDEAIISVICMGEDVLMHFIRDELTIGKKMGKIPEGTPQLPIQKDFEKKAKTYRFKFSEEAKDYKLDLRTERGLQKSTFLHQLNLLNIKWGDIKFANTKGTFKEVWSLAWQPEISLDIIDKGIWGNTIELAAQNFVNHIAKTSENIKELTEFIDKSLVAQLFDSVKYLIDRIQNLVSLSSDVVALMEAVIPLIDISRYSDIRQTDQTVLNSLIEGLLSKIFISLEVACYGIDDKLAEYIFSLITSLNEKLSLLENDEISNNWIGCLQSMADQENVSALIKGAVYRIMLDNEIYDQEKVHKSFGRALSVGSKPIDSAYWIEGFLKGSAMILILDNTIWNLLYIWLQDLDSENFDDLLPILRRTFSNYSTNERNQLGQKARKGLGKDNENIGDFNLAENFNHKRAEKALKRTFELLGY